MGAVSITIRGRRLLSTPGPRPKEAAANAVPPDAVDTGETVTAVTDGEAEGEHEGDLSLSELAEKEPR